MKTEFAIVKGFCGSCDELKIAVVAEGVEAAEVLTALRQLGVTLLQRSLIAEPRTGELPAFDWHVL